MDRKRGRGEEEEEEGGGRRDRKEEEIVGEPNKVQSMAVGSEDMSWGESESKTKKWKS